MLRTLSEKLKALRTDRPDEWTMDEFLRDAIKLEKERDEALEKLSAMDDEISSLPAKWSEDSSLETWFPLTSEELESLRKEGADLRAKLAEMESNKLYSTDQYLECDKSKIPVAYYLPAVNGYHERVTLDEKTARHWSSHMAAKIIELVPSEKSAVDWPKINELVAVFIDEYHYLGDGGYYCPTEWEKALMTDCISGLLDELPLNPVPADKPAVAVPDRELLRSIVDKAWNEATESQNVPSTKWADQIIDGVIAAAPSHSQQSADGCLCQGCGNRYVADLLVPDDVWEQIKPEGKSVASGLLCPNCIMTRIIERGIWSAGKAHDCDNSDVMVSDDPEKCTVDCAVAAIEFALENEDPITFLRMWMQGDFPEIRESWDNVPESVFIGADPLLKSDRCPSHESEQGGAV